MALDNPDDLSYLDGVFEKQVRTMARVLGVTVTMMAMLASVPASAEEKSYTQQDADRDYGKALRYVKARSYKRALRFFERSLPHQNTTSDIYYNMSAVAEELKLWAKVFTYTNGFLYLEPKSADAKAIRKRRRKALGALKRSPKTTPVEVTFALDPADVEISVDHVLLANKKALVVPLLPGKHLARAHKEDFEPFEQAFVVEVSKPLTVEGKLKPILFYGHLKIITTPAEGVRVYIDDREVGVTPLEPQRLEAGKKYLVRFEKEGWDRWMRQVEIKKNKTHELLVKMYRSTE